jgi:alpha-ketoglutarate-dependent 2,4-dichlorophenoxyacetate dioxygenase
MTFTVNRLGPEFGGGQADAGAFAAEFIGANLHQPPNDALIEAFEAAMARFAVVVLRDQHIDDAEQIRFARAFGPLELPPHMGMRPAAMKVRVGYGLYDISNLDANGEFLPADSLRLIFNKSNENFHTDSSFNSLPTKWSMLSARIIPPEGGDTEFCDARAAWDALPVELRERARQATAEHWLWKTRVDAGNMPISDEMRNAMPPARHPVVRKIPDSGRETLYLGAHVTHIVDWPKADSESFVAAINAHIARPEFRYVHQWRVGDLLVWDNRCTLHRATPYEVFRHKRDLRRATINEYGAEVSSTTALGIPPPKTEAGPYG